MSQTKWPILLAACQQLPWWYMALSVIVYGLAQWLSAFRWQQIATCLHFQLPTFAYFRLYLTGMFYSQCLPGTIGGDGYRVWQLSQREQSSNYRALMSVLAERGLGLTSLLWLTGIWGCCISTPLHGTRGIVIGLALFSLITYGVSFWIVTRTSLSERRWLAPLKQLLTTGRLVPTLLGVSFLIQLGMIGIHLILAYGLKIQVLPEYLAYTYGCIVLLTLLPISVNGLGLREVGYVHLLGWVGVPASQAMALSLCWFLVGLLTSLLGCLPLIQRK